MAKQVTTINTQDYELGKVQGYVADALNRLPSTYPILNSRTVEATINTTDTTIEHKLGRPVQGYIVTSQDANSIIWKSSSAVPNPNGQIILIASALVNVKIYFF